MKPQPDQAAKPSEGGEPGAGAPVVGLIVIIGLAFGWFLLARFVMHSGLVDAAGEALGVTFGLLMVASVVGAISASRGRSPH